jgi:hypothetical protein
MQRIWALLGEQYYIGEVPYGTNYYVKKAGSALGVETDSGKIINESDPTKKKDPIP